MSYRAVKSRRAVLQAIGESRLLGREAFRAYYHFEESDTYYLRYEGEEFDSKPIIAVAHKYQFPDLGPLPNNFSGGKSHAARHLARLGFTVDGVRLNEDDWDLGEVTLIVDEYFRMFDAVRKGVTPVKEDWLKLLGLQLPRRNKSAVSRKLSNISGILKRAELPWLPGFAPLLNSQTLLEAVVNDWLSENARFFESADTPRNFMIPLTEVEVAPPTPSAVSEAAQARRATRTNFAERDERNRQLGAAGEKWAVSCLKGELIKAGRSDLAEQVEHVSDTQGDGLGYDILSFNKDGMPEFVEVKTTNGGHAAPFLVTANEIGMSAVEKSYVLFRIFNFSREPRFYRLRGSLQASCKLSPQVYRASPN